MDKFKLCQRVLVRSGHHKGHFGMVADVVRSPSTKYHISFSWGGSWIEEEDLIPDTKLTRAIYG